MKAAIVGEEFSYPKCEPRARKDSRLDSSSRRSSGLRFTAAYRDYGEKKKNERERKTIRNNINLKLGRWNFSRRHLIFFEFHCARKRIRCASRVAVSTSLGTLLSPSPDSTEGARLDSDPYFKVLLPKVSRRDLSSPSSPGRGLLLRPGFARSFKSTICQFLRRCDVAAGLSRSWWETEMVNVEMRERKLPYFRADLPMSQDELPANFTN